MRNPKPRRSCLETGIPAVSGDRFLSELKRLVEGLSAEGFKAQYLQEEFLTKYCDLTTTAPADRRSAAISKWRATELRNAKTNFRLYLEGVVLPDPYKGSAQESPAPEGLVDFGWTTAQAIIQDARALISRVLGPLVYPGVLQSGNFTNGASTRVRKSPSGALLKLTGEAHISSAAVKHWCAAFSGSRMSNQTLHLQESSMLFTVPKKSDIDRVAAKEPECNMLLQRSVGNHIRRRLKVFGIDLNDQSVNRELARVAVAKKLATVDLSAASDSITQQLVMNLLPFDWYSLLSDLRVESVLIEPPSGQLGPVQQHRFEMFSSMGNGFTFELESLIFYAIVRAVCRLSGLRGRISVFGDDIVMPAKAVPRLKSVFAFFGFKLNPEKTHYRGPFRESCGGHYWRGFDVKPFYVRRAVRELRDLINILNRLLEWDGRGWGFFTSVEAYEFWSRWKEHVPKFLWGGIDPMDPTALVTGDRPRKRLVPETRKSVRPDDPAITYWLLSRASGNGVVTASVFDDPTSPETILQALDGCQDDVHLVVDPRIVVGWKARPLISHGVRTTWDPGAIHAPRS